LKPKPLMINKQDY